ncbi:hypothetical protein D3C80_814590 [compost metagenome]
MAFRQQQGTGKWKDRHGFRQVVVLYISRISDVHGIKPPVHCCPAGGATALAGICPHYENSIAESFRRPATVAGSLKPQASKNSRSWRRAPSSSKVRSLRMI